MMAGSRRASVQTVQGFWLSILPHTRQTSIFSSAVCIAAASGAMICSRFLMRKSAARRAERGPKPRQTGEQLDQTLDLGSGGGGHGGEVIGATWLTIARPLMSPARAAP